MKSVTTTQKIIKIGSSKGVILPSSSLKEIGADLGTEVRVSIEPVVPNSQDKLMKEYGAFIEQYGEALRNLADR